MTRADGKQSIPRVNVDNVIEAVASRQHGVVTRAQLLRAGVLPDVVDRRLKAKRLRAVHRGVYLVGPLVARYALEMAAVLACGATGVLSHWSAAALWQLHACRNAGASVEVTSRGGVQRRVCGIRVYRVRNLQSDEVTLLDGIPITTVPRTLYDLAGVASQRDLARALGEALSRGLTSRAELVALSARFPRRRGAARLRALLDTEAQPSLTRSKAEKRFLALIRKAHLPSPDVNTSVAGHRVDFLWRAERFVVEVDGFAFHSSAERFESDRRRDAELAAAGLRVVRVTWRQLMNEPEAMLIRLALALARTSRD